MTPPPQAVELERLPALTRMHHISRLLREKPCTIRDLAHHLYPSAPLVDRTWRSVERSLQRDLERLRHLGLDIQTQGGKPPRYHIPSPPEHLSTLEALAVHAALRLMVHHSPTHNAHYLSALQKLARHLPASAGQSLQGLPLPPTRQYEDTNLELIARAWFEGRALRFEYGRGQEREPDCELEPYYIEVNRQNLATYVIGREVKRNAVRTLKLSRMHHLTLTERPYTIPADFSPASVIGGAWGVIGNQQGAIDIELEFAPEAAYRILEGGYLGMSEPSLHASGRVRVTIHAGVDNTGLPREVIPWIYSWGPRVEVLGPPNVRAHWLREIQTTLQNATQNAKGEVLA